MFTKKVAIIGTGFIGLAHLDALRRLPDVEVVALCDAVNAKEQAEKLNIPQYFNDYIEMINTIKLDAVHVATPNHTHFPISMYAIEHGIHVMCEKPFTTTIEEAYQLADAAKANGISGAVNYHNRFYPIPRQMKAMIDSGEAGDIISVTGGYQQDWLLYNTDFNWRLLKKNAGNTRIVGDIGSHWLDLAQFVTGQKIISVMAEFRTVYSERMTTDTYGNSQYVPIDTEDIATFMCRFENDTLGSGFVTGMMAGKKNQTLLTIAGKNAALQWDSEQNINDLWIGHRSAPNQILTKDPSLLYDGANTLSSYPGGHAEGFPDAFTNHFRHFYATLNDKSLPVEYCTFAQGAREMRIIEAIYESSQTKKWVDIPL